jgi:hypothetical protein
MGKMGASRGIHRGRKILKTQFLFGSVLFDEIGKLLDNCMIFFRFGLLSANALPILSKIRVMAQPAKQM